VPELTRIGPSSVTFWHVSEDGGIERFEPREIDGTSSN
jgi:hypothetical protein